MSVLKKHFDPKPLVIAERFQFHKRAQNIGESTTDYVGELRRFTIHCQYDTHLEEALSDRLVCGIRDERTHKKLLVIDKLTLARAIEIAQGEEAVNKNAEALKAKETTVMHLPIHVTDVEIHPMNKPNVGSKCRLP